MTIFTDADRAYLTEMRAITTNSKGQEVLVGLSLEETEFYMKFTNSKVVENEGPSEKDTAYYLELDNKHQKARQGILIAENQLRVDKPTLN